MGFSSAGIGTGQQSLIVDSFPWLSQPHGQAGPCFHQSMSWCTAGSDLVSWPAAMANSANVLVDPAAVGDQSL